jgi:hypothetical protein
VPCSKLRNSERGSWEPKVDFPVFTYVILSALYPIILTITILVRSDYLFFFLRSYWLVGLYFTKEL